MKIDSVRLENVRSYVDATVHFGTGTVALVGQNGHGKSTVLSALGWALFDHLEGSQGEFVRTGEKTARVTVSFEHDGHAYTVTRSCGGTSSYTLERDGTQVADGKAEVMLALARVHGTDDFTTLFRDAVGVPQGTLTSAFLLSPANRRTVFDPLLRVDEYGTAWSNLRHAERLGEQRLADQEKQVAALEARTEPLAQWRQRDAELAREIAAQEERLTALDRQHARLTQELAQWDAQERIAQQTKEAVTLAERERDHLRQRLQDAADRLAEADQAQARVDQALADHGEYEQVTATLKDLEAQRRERDTLQARLSRAENDLAVVSEKLATLAAQRDAAEAAKDEVARLTPLATEQTALEAKLSDLRALVVAQQAATQRLMREGRTLADLQTTLLTAQRNLATVERYQADLADLAQRLETLRDTEWRIREDGQSAKLRHETCCERLTALDRAEAACPVCATPLTPAHKTTLLSQLRAERDAAQEARDALATRWQTVRKEIATLEQQAEALRRDLQKLGTPDVVDLQARLAAQEQVVAEVEAEIRSYGNPEEGVEQLGEQLSALGDPKAQLAVAQAEAFKADGLFSSYVNADVKRQQVEQALAAAQDALHPFAGLEAQVAGLQERQTALEPAHRQVLVNQPLADKLPVLQEALTQAQRELTAAQESLDAALSERDALSYDPEAHVSVRRALSAVESDAAAAHAVRAQLQAEQARVAQEIADLKVAQAELQRTQADYERLKSSLEHLHFLRQAIKDAGPEIAKLLVASISVQADRIFGEILGDPDAHLVWTEDYDIVVTAGDQTRHFAQLSGGEQMSAALAVRLALLREISNVDLAFFDEPTVNLDAQRRESLAAQILNVQGFTQLFVISHDDAFEQGTDYVVRVVKEQGVSRVL